MDTMDWDSICVAHALSPGPTGSACVLAAADEVGIGLLVLIPMLHCICSLIEHCTSIVHVQLLM